MKRYRLEHQTVLLKWLVLLALVCSLFAFLGGDHSYQIGLNVTPQTELVATTSQELTQRVAADDKIGVKQFFTTYSRYQIAVLLFYNRLITNRIRLICDNWSSIRKVNKFIRTKTIPSSFNDPYLPSPRG